MLLALDIGNTNIKIGVFSAEKDSSSHTPVATWRLNTESGRTLDEYGLMITNLLPLRGIQSDSITDVALCSAVPPLRSVFREMSKTYFGIDPLIVGTGVKTGIRILYDNPRDVGAERIVDAVAALNLYGGPVIVVDFGTGTVFDAITADGEYLGGAIAPGISIAAEALYRSASQLRRVELERPQTAIGTNTIHALQSGLVLGYTDIVKGMVTRFNQELGGGSKVVATGGFAELIGAEPDLFDAVNQDLTLSGLKIIYEMNQ